MRETVTAERESFGMWLISVVPTMAEPRAKGSVAGIINSFLLKMACRTSAGMICAAHTARFAKRGIQTQSGIKAYGTCQGTHNYGCLRR